MEDFRDFPRFRPRPPWLGGDLQTLRNTLVGSIPRRRAEVARHPAEPIRVAMPDGSGDVLVGMVNRPQAPAMRPVAVLVHGLTGCAESYYALSTAALLLDHGFPVLRINLRGAGASRPLCRGQYHAGRSDDVRAVLAALDPDLVRHGVVVVGYSLGGNVVLKMLGEDGGRSPVRAAVSVSAPIDLAATAQQMMRPRNALYQRWILNRMKQEALAPAAPVGPAERQRVLAVRTVYEFDDVFVAPRNGFGTAERYYALNNARRFLDAIRVPALVIHGLDDPWIPAAAYLETDWQGNPMLVPLLPSGGGHVGFHDCEAARGGRAAWHDRCLLRFFAGL